MHDPKNRDLCDKGRLIIKKLFCRLAFCPLLNSKTHHTVQLKRNLQLPLIATKLLFRIWIMNAIFLVTVCCALWNQPQLAGPSGAPTLRQLIKTVLRSRGRDLLKKPLLCTCDTALAPPKSVSYSKTEEKPLTARKGVGI
jgi:hypothetical protein